MKKKKWVNKAYTIKSLVVGLFFVDVLLFFSILNKFLGWFEGFTNLLLNLFQEFGYDLNLVGILIGVICAFVFGFLFSYWYLWIKHFFGESKV